MTNNIKQTNGDFEVDQTSFTQSETERANALNAIHKPTIDFLKDVKPRGFKAAISTIREAIEYNLKNGK